MDKQQNKYSIRKFTFGASSILIGSLLFLGVGTAQAAEEDHQTDTKAQQLNGNQLGNDNQEKLVNEAPATPTENDNAQTKDENNTKNLSLHNEQQSSQANGVDEGNTVDPEYNAKDKAEQEKEAVDPEYNAKDKAEQEKEAVDPEYNAKDKAEQEKETVDPEYNAKDKAEQEKEAVDPEYNAKDKAEQEKEAVDPEYNAKDKAEQEKETVDPEYNAKDKAEQEKEAVDPEYNAKDKAEQEKETIDPEYNAKDKAEQEKEAVDPEYNAKDKAEQEKETVDPEYNAKDKAEQEKEAVDPEYNQPAKNKLTENTDTSSTELESSNKQGDNVNADKANISLDKLNGEKATDTHSDDNRKDSQDKTLKTLKENAIATPKNQTQQSVAKTDEQPNKTAKQGQYKNQDPIILVHGFNGFTDDINPSVLSHYWGGDKLNIRQDLESNGYETYEASVGALSSNYDRAVELYYYIKGGTVDYGAAHAEKYGHDRYGKTYEGVYKDWQPGQKVHLVAHSMGGQTVRQLEELLRNGNKEELAYQQAHGGEISPLYQGNNDNMINSITTLGTPHNGTIAADKLGNEALVRQLAFDYAKFKGNKNSRVDFGFGQWGLKQREGESYANYVQRVQNSALWTTQDNGFYDLTREGADKLNKQTSLNPNIVYKTYTGESTRPTLLGKQKSDIDMFLRFTVTGNLIGKAAEKDWRVNDGLVSTISSLHPFNQDYTEATDKVQKGIWQVTPIRHGWDHVDFVGQDATDYGHSTEELQQFWHGLAEDLVRNEQVEA
ncbi:YSIRK-targeted triacylglycerol lipase [Staphylococcus edaphicus]|uniref:triacylglycerol lipase n=1 Tax=Staphylococcus edaphicus TaxID=1955013 RepID=A0A2C6WLK5_9STAP|nr:YSIRK-type signal peptide-containing protein [Staphylococcus edaphicus]PHK49023.1 lipase [Staphylococcus edaphicus]UQW81348.1 YSIRK-type signal peptide-containing protein [Staphylococcus edaphicus]